MCIRLRGWLPLRSAQKRQPRWSKRAPEESGAALAKELLSDGYPSTLVAFNSKSTTTKPKATQVCKV